MERKYVYIRIVLKALLISAAFLLFPAAFALLSPFLVAFMIAWMLNPVILRISRLVKLPRKPLVLILLILLYAAVGGLLVVIVSQLVGQILAIARDWTNIASQGDRIIDVISQVVSSLFKNTGDNGIIDAIVKTIADLGAALKDELQRILSALVPYASGIAVSVGESLIFLLAMVMGSYFISANYLDYRNRITNTLSEESRVFLNTVKDSVKTALGGFFKAQFIFATVAFGISLIYLIAIGIDYAMVIALILGIMEFVPFFGCGSIILPWAIIDFITGDTHMGVMILILFGITAVVRKVIEPRVIGRVAGLSPMMTLFAMYAGLRLGGVWGLVLGSVVAMIAANINRSGVLDATKEDLQFMVRDMRMVFRRRGPE